ncbi:hypothetical protein RCL_jg28746.t1 [Rhizophagus clarus]|uniref:Uncharacterized protein n=1 Tax=Rhizophagus clarus TaxID=94130 RepID=A0A8H3LWB4_9GLOM|nr:hypothetical protein RCL_jg28746.t1 [Rhizophagus clarus]
MIYFDTWIHKYFRQKFIKKNYVGAFTKFLLGLCIDIWGMVYPTFLEEILKLFIEGFSSFITRYILDLSERSS